MKMNGTRQRLVALAQGESVPLELTLGSERIDVWLDARGIHFQQDHEKGVSEGFLPWDIAIASSLVPESWRRAAPST